MKFLAAILVVSIHTNPFSSVSSVMNFGFVNTIARIAVPFFFITSGYFFYSKLGKYTSENEKFIDSYLIKYLKRISVIYLFWSLVYFIYDIYASYRVHHDIIFSLAVYIMNFILNGSHFHLWYFPALIFATIMLYFGSRILPLKYILLISFGFYIVGLFGDSYFGFIKGNSFLSNIYTYYFKFFGTTRNGLFFGLVYVTLGAFLCEKKLSIKPSTSGLFFCISIVGLVSEVFLLKNFTEPKDFNMMLLLLPTSYFLLQFLINVKAPSWNIDYKMLRDSSALIYCSHGIFLTIYPKLISLFVHNHQGLHSVFWFFLILLSSLVFSILIMRLRQNEKTSKYVSLTY